MHVPSSKAPRSRIDTLSSALLAVVPRSLHRLVRFGLSGIAATLFYIALTNVLVLALHVPPVTASVCAYILSIGVSYILQSRFTFQVGRDSFDQIAKFVVTSIAGLAVSWCVMAWSTNLMAWPYFVGATIVCFLIPVANFFMFRGWVFAVGRSAEVSS
ncbi:putative flippase GtrA [Nitrobacteraceae bacterium AZCC 1564]